MGRKQKDMLEKERKRATFPLAGLIAVLEPQPEIRDMKLKVWSTLQDDAEFQRPTCTPSAEEQKRLTARMLRRLHTLLPQFLPPDIMQSNYTKKTRHIMAMNEALAIYNRSLSVKFALGVSLFGNALPSLGTRRHLHYCDSAWKGDILSCFAITEFGHGSNTKLLRTTATYDPRTEQFVLHTPDFQAAKCWAGNLGRTCTFSIVFAQLQSADGQQHGLHGFIVPVRDPKTLLPFPGVTVGDMGEKAGLNGIDNGFLMFSHYRIPKANLLNKTGDVDEQGNYVSSFTDPQQILGAALENLSAGRVGISQESTNTLSCAVSIAIRYGAVRVQFGPQPGTEQPLIDYPTHQWRLFPYLAAACSFKIFIFDFISTYLQTVETSYSSKNAKINELSEIVGEIHAIVSACKPLLTWTCRDGIQISREACGGHGYLKSAAFGDLRNDHDPSVTYEGDNTVLIQQTSNWLVRQFDVDAVSSPLGTVNFLARKRQIATAALTATQRAHVTNIDFIIGAYEWLLCWLLQETSSRMSALQKDGANRFTARTHCQVYLAGPLSLAFAEYNVISICQTRLAVSTLEPSVRAVVERTVILYGLWCLDRHLPYFYQGGFAKGPEMSRLIRDAVVALCAELRPDVVSVVDGLAPPDFALNSVLGCADGDVYRHLEESLVTAAAVERAPWWRDTMSKL